MMPKRTPRSVYTQPNIAQATKYRSEASKTRVGGKFPAWHKLLQEVEFAVFDQESQYPYEMEPRQ